MTDKPGSIMKSLLQLLKQKREEVLVRLSDRYQQVEYEFYGLSVDQEYSGIRRSLEGARWPRPKESPYVAIAQAVEYSGIPASSLRHFARTGAVNARKANGRWDIEWISLLDHLRR